MNQGFPEGKNARSANAPGVFYAKTVQQFMAENF